MSLTSVARALQSSSSLTGASMATCPTSLLPASTLEACLEWQSSESSKYNCSADAFLASLTPGKYAGVTANYLSFNTEVATPHYPRRAEMLTRCTGGTIVFSEAEDVAVDPINDIGSASATGAELYDAYLMIYSFTSEASSLGLFETLNDRIREKTTQLQYEDIFPKVRNMGEYRKDGKTNIDLLMSDGDFFVPVVRIDLLERDGLPLPQTWDDLVELANYYNGTDLNDDGETHDDWGFCIYPRTGSGFNDAWIPELMYSTWASTDQTRGIQEGFLFDDQTFEPRIGTGFEKAMNYWKELWPLSADACITSTFAEGRCAIGIAPPGCWKGIFVDAEEGGIAWRNRTNGDWGPVLRDENGEALWRPTWQNGTYAEPYRLKPLGSLVVVDRETDQLVECGPKTCPKGEKIKPSDELPEDDRARVLVDSPHVGKWINRVPFYWSGGYGTGIRRSANDKVKDLMFDFFAYVNSPITSVDDIVIPSWLDDWRYSQLESYERNYKEGGWNFNAWNEHQRVQKYSLGNDVNSARTLQLPGVLLYTRDVMLEQFQKYVAGETTIEVTKHDTIAGWNDATAVYGKINQLDNYRAALGLDSLTTYQKCTLHREEMDAIDPAICKEETDNSTLIIIILCSIVGAGILGLVMYFSYKRYKSFQTIKKAHEQQMESTLNEATRALRQLDYPLHLVRGDEFVAEKQLMRHEVLRNTHRLTVLDNIGDVDAFIQTGKQVVFFSHQWTAFNHPDPSNDQYNCMVEALRELARRNGWNDNLRDCDILRHLCPETKHTDLDDVCDLATYQRRMWCRAEQVCYSMRNGTAGMFLAKGRPGSIEFGPVESDFFIESLHVFNGDLTCCRLSTRQSLVVPILGLYGELLRAAHDGVKGGTSDLSAVKAFLKEVETHLEDVFPRKFKRVMWRKNKRVLEEVTLFGDLIDRMRARIKNGNMFVPVERGGTESTMSSTDFLRHGANDSIMHGVMDINSLALPPQDNFLRHGSLNVETPSTSTTFSRHGGGGAEEA
eukprot:CCRYP_015874-RB/>CCRYP_015874-RB protein AED:0.14 eAED:0.15 QI:553/0.71/0.62/1/0.85/0.75/8/0/1009